MSATPSKSVSKTSKRLKVKAEVVAPGDDERGPFVAYFPSGFIPQNSMLARHGPDEPELLLKAYENNRVPKNPRHMLVAETKVVDFVGTTVTAEGQSWNPCQYALGVFNKKTGALQLMPVTGGKVLRMEPRVRGVSYETGIQVEEEKTVEEEAAARDSRGRQKRSLTEAFGSKKRRRYEEALEKGAVTEGNIAAAKAVGQLVQEASRKRGMLTQEEVNAKIAAEQPRNVPPHNVLAETPEEAYPVKAIVPDWQWRKLKADELTAAANGKAEGERVKRFYPTFVTRRLDRLRVANDKVGNERRARLLLYITYLMRFYRAPPSLTFRRKVEEKQTDGTGAEKDENAAGDGGEDGEDAKVDGGKEKPGPGKDEDVEYFYTSNDPATVAKGIKVPVHVVERCISEFSAIVPGQKPGDSERIVRSQKHTDLLLSTILVLALHVDSFVLDPEDIGRDLKLSPKMLLPHLRELGCKVSKEKGGAGPGGEILKFKITLPLPLTFPKIGRGGRK